MLTSSIDSHARVELARLRRESRLGWGGRGRALAEIWVAWTRVVSGSRRGGGCAARANADSQYLSLLSSERTGGRISRVDMPVVHTTREIHPWSMPHEVVGRVGFSRITSAWFHSVAQRYISITISEKLATTQL